MANYNPNLPHILGEEWVPIREDVLELSPVAPTEERGYRFFMDAAATLATGRFHVAPEGIPTNLPRTYYAMSVYVAGTEDDSGPLRSVIIPVDSVSVTGGCTLVGGAANGAQALLVPTTDYYYNFNSVSAYSVMWINFNTALASYANLLTDKRIVAVNMLLGAAGGYLDGFPLFGFVQTANVGNLALGKQTGTLSQIAGIPNFGGSMTRLRLGTRVPYNSTSLTTGEVLPYTYADLALLDASAGTPTFFYIATGAAVNTPVPAGVSFQVWYAALEVVYCQERRIALGSWNSLPQNSANWGANLTSPMRAWPAKTINPSLAVGAYGLTIASIDAPNDLDSPIQINALRELYPIDSVPSVHVNTPFPPEDNLEAEFTSEYDPVIPQLTLHTSSAVITNIHPYGRLAAMQVCQTAFANQQVYDAFGAAAGYTQLRYYARKRGQPVGDLIAQVLSGSPSSCVLTSAAFDLLDEIVDGWKEVTLTLSNPCGMGNTTNKQWQWTSPSSPDYANRWEMLGVAAPALSGLPGNLWGLSPQQLDTATYQAPTGGTARATWFPGGVTGPYFAGTSADNATDVVFMFALDSPSITGVAVSEQIQQLTGIGLDCGIAPCAIPTGLRYNRITWPVPSVLQVLFDTFNRTVASNWGSADTGQAWVPSGGSASDYNVSGGTGTQLLSAVNVLHHSTIPSATGIGVDFDISANVSLAIGNTNVAPINMWVAGRLLDQNNYYSALLQMNSTTFSIQLFKRVAGTPTALAGPVTLTTGHVGGEVWRVRFRGQGNFFQAKAWQITGEEPEAWQTVANDSSLTTGNGLSLISRAETGNTNVNPVVSWSNVVALASPSNFGHYELQRMDSLTDWQTIMLASSQAVTGFNDYEARVGLLSSYRVRVLDVYDFAGPWSSTVTITLTSPGVSGGSCGGDPHFLIFTSNESPTGAYNLAYSSVWEAKVDESFTFPEAGFTQLQAMYGRDFFTAFRPQERGGEQFSRSVLVQAAAIAPETLADFTGLRSMAWADLPYVCVRDEDGNRWFANVTVPSGRVQLNRTLYVAPVNIIEVTATASPVDP